jgi:hypothetical protein
MGRRKKQVESCNGQAMTDDGDRARSGCGGVRMERRRQWWTDGSEGAVEEVE